VPTEAPTAGPTLQPTAPPRTGQKPPDGVLASGKGDSAGWLGTFCWNDTCRDAGYIAPKDELPALAADGNSELTFSLVDGTQFAGWTASYSQGSNGPVTELGEGGDLYDTASVDELASASFPAPPPGDWVVHVGIYFTDGDAFYVWHVTAQ
jgi:hypothetical protein